MTDNASGKTMAVAFPRPHDSLGHAWGLDSEMPEQPWERLSAAYEHRLEQLILALEHHGYEVQIRGAGGQDGEFIVAKHPTMPLILQHLEDPSEMAAIAALLERLTTPL